MTQKKGLQEDRVINSIYLSKTGLLLPMKIQWRNVYDKYEAQDHGIEPAWCITYVFLLLYLHYC